MIHGPIHKLITLENILDACMIQRDFFVTHYTHKYSFQTEFSMCCYNNPKSILYEP